MKLLLQVNMSGLHCLRFFCETSTPGEYERFTLLAFLLCYLHMLVASNGDDLKQSIFILDSEAFFAYEQQRLILTGGVHFP
jgi:hypothetical protein